MTSTTHKNIKPLRCTILNPGVHDYQLKYGQLDQRAIDHLTVEAKTSKFFNALLIQYNRDGWLSYSQWSVVKNSTLTALLGTHSNTKG